MRNPFCLGVLGCLVFAHLSAGQSLEGTWRQTTPNVGQSDWVLADNGDGTYKAREFGLGNAQGVGRFKNGTLTVDWKYDGGTGVSEWKLKGDAGTGAIFEPRGDNDKSRGTAVAQLRGGAKVWAFEKLTIQRLPAPSNLVQVWKQTTPNVGVSVWTLAQTSPGKFRATETGLGNVTGTAQIKDGTLTVNWKQGSESGVCEWKLNGDTGKGTLFDHQAGGVQRVRNGKKMRAYDGSTLTSLGVKMDPKAPDTLSLPVKLIAQENAGWCFAAVTQMVLDYHGTKVSQGELLNVFTGRKDCAQVPTPKPCIIGGSEPKLFEHFRYTLDFRLGPLTPEEVVREIYTRRKPMIFGFAWKDGGSHSMVLVGYAKVKGGFLVEVCDPGGGARYWTTYQQWVADANHFYQDSQFNISKPKRK